MSLESIPIEQDPLGQLEYLLKKHLKLVGDGKLESVLEDGARVNNLLGMVSESGQGSAEQIERVVKLHKKLHLLSLTEKQQMQSSLGKMRQGKLALRKYQGMK